MMTPAFVCMIPKEEKYTKILMVAFMVYQYEFDAVINANNYRTQPKPKWIVILSLEKYLKAIAYESVFEESKKSSYLVAWNILAPSDKLNGSLGVKKRVMDAAKAWRKFANLTEVRLKRSTW